MTIGSPQHSTISINHVIPYYQSAGKECVEKLVDKIKLDNDCPKAQNDLEPSSPSSRFFLTNLSQPFEWTKYKGSANYQRLDQWDRKLSSPDWCDHEEDNEPGKQQAKNPANGGHCFLILLALLIVISIVCRYVSCQASSIERLIEPFGKDAKGDWGIGDVITVEVLAQGYTGGL